MRYCFVLPHFDELENSFSKLLAPVIDALLKQGDKVCILSGNRSYQGVFQAMHVSVNVPKIKPAFLYNILFVLKNTMWLFSRKRRFDVIHNIGVGSTLCQNVLTAHACHRAWISTKWKMGQYFSLFFNPLHAFTFLIESINYRRNIPVIAVSETLASQIIRFYPAARDRIKIINNGVRKPELNASNQRTRFFSEGDFVISFASNDHKKKGIIELLEAIHFAKKSGRNWRLLVLGFDDKQKKIEKYIQSLDIKECVVFMGHVLNIHEYIATSEIFCLPSYYESFGLVFIEAAQTGVPVVGTDVGIYPELLGPTSNFKALPRPVKSQELFQTLSRLEDDVSARKKLADICQMNSKMYSVESMIKEHILFYKNLEQSPENAVL